MKNLFSVPNLLSLGNLLCGCIATLNIVEGNLYPAAFLIGLASVFDFLDGFAARGLKQGSPMGKELDSLADMVTFGVVPGMMMFQLLRYGLADHQFLAGAIRDYLPYLGFVIPLFSGLRLAKFNVDTRQSESFIGLPTLANAIFVSGLPFLLEISRQDFQMAVSETAGNGFVPALWNQFSPDGVLLSPNWLSSPVLLAGLTVVMSVLLISPIPMFSFKVKNVNWKGNEIRYIFLLLSAGLVAVFRLKAISMVIVLYLLLSLVYAGMKKSRT